MLNAKVEPTLLTQLPDVWNRPLGLFVFIYSYQLVFRWLDNPGVNDGGLGLQAIKLMTQDAARLADKLNPQDRNRLLNLCTDINRLADQLADLERRGLGNSPEAHAIRQQLKDKLRELADFMKKILTERVVSVLTVQVIKTTL